MPNTPQTDQRSDIPGQPVTLPVTSVPLAGIGGSAGGLDAFTRLLEHLPSDTGYAFIFVQHLDAHHPSSLSDILGRATAMPVVEATAGLAVAANHVYVIAPNTELTIAGGVLHMAPRTTAPTQLPCDRLFESIALDRGRDAVGVVMSGNGSDGSAGLLAIKAAGGATFAQEPSSAANASMPTMAAEAGGADLVLTPEDIASEIARLAHDGSRAANVPETGVDQGTRDAIRTICDVMHGATGIDFALYRETTVRRRILRRLTLVHVADLAAYARMLADTPDERAALQRDLLIGVTSFFREPESFAALKAFAFPAIVRGRPPTSPIRIWVPGCATGQEAYSILIALQEYQNEAHTQIPVQVFASDLSERSIDTARRGRYSLSIAEEMTPERLREHFALVEGQYQIRKDLRERCIFSRHNLLEDPPFSKLDLISCRNVLIYLDTAQRRIIPSFHYALVEGGFLLLGRSEATRHPELFSPVEPRQHLYARRTGTKRIFSTRVRAPYVSDSARTEDQPPRARSAASPSNWSREADRVLLDKYAPSGLVVDEALTVLEIRGQAAPFLSLATGRASFQLLKLLPDATLFLAVEQLVADAVRTRVPARREALPYSVAGARGTVTVEVQPLGPAAGGTYLVLFETVASSPVAPGLPSPASPPDPRMDEDTRVATLLRELEDARRRLLSQLDEQVALDEEHQQITEDTLSSNEELKSLTEELETAKEELQSTNEELLTMNRELESRNAALSAARDLAKVIVETVSIPLIVIDKDLVVRHVNTAFVKAFRLSAAECDGQPLLSLDGGAWSAQALRTQLTPPGATDVSFDALEIERAFTAAGPRTLLLSGRALRQLSLTLLTVLDVTEQRRTEQSLHVKEEQVRQSEKMETLGRLAGGIAHDFNNLLTVIIGAADLAGESLGRPHPVTIHIDAIRESAARAASLTEQLLAFSRRKVLQPQVFDLNPLTLDFCRMLRRLVSERVTIVERPAPEPCVVRADPAEIGRAVMNLCLNARDAMPVGGRLTVETGHVAIDAVEAAAHGIREGAYVRLCVSDTGIGMSDETQRQIFEPFFTTKDLSKGAGLGLATVFGILQESGGAVWCESTLGHGARFIVVLPVSTDTPDSDALRPMPEAPHGTGEVILVVEDNDAVRRLSERILERYKYQVLTASHGTAALSILRDRGATIDLLITDVVMPDITGGTLAQQAVLLNPALKVLFVSGYAEDDIVREGVRRGSAFLAKPFTAVALARKVRDVLDADEPHGTTGA